MTTNRRAWLGALTFCVLPALAWADPPVGPTNHAVLLPPQITGDSENNPILPPFPNDAVMLPAQGFDTAVKSPNSHGEWTIDGGVYLLHPVFQTNPAFAVTSAGGNISRQVDFGYRLDAAPTIWLGYVNERGWGVRGRWFEFDQTSSATFGAAPGETVTGMSPLALGNVPVNGAVAATSRLAVNVVDLQGTYTYESPRWTHLLGLGVRYTSLTQDYQAAISAPATNLNLTASHDLTGAGPCFSLETKYRLAETGFSLYGQIYGSIVFGHAGESYSALNNGVRQQMTGNPNSILPVGELELGAEYQKHVGRATLFLQAGFNGQIWWGGGNASNLDGVGASSATHNNFGFLGIALRAGVRY
jgi:Legionella pneumophila major outer membrane protein precursor